MKKNKAASAVGLGFTVLFALAACAMGPRMQQVSPGMTEAELVELLGTPDGMIVEGDYRALQWANRLMSGWSNTRADYWAVLRDGRVTAYGPGDVRSDPVRGTIVLVPLPG